MGIPLSTRVAETLRTVARKGGYELTKSHRMAKQLDRQHELLRLAAKGIELPKDKGKAPLAEGIVFSKDRPLQLHLLLQSYADMVANPAPLHVLYAASNDDFDKAFKEVAKCFPQMDITWTRETRFRPALLPLLETLRAEKMFFLMDDDVVINKWDMEKYASINPDEAVLSLIVSPQMTHCYTTQRAMPAPAFTSVKDHPELREFKWGASYDIWNYPNTVDGTLFSTREMRLMANLTEYKAPNSFEGALMEFAHGFRQRKGYCYPKCVLMNLPLNKVQTENNNPAGGSDVEGMLAQWNDGLAIDPTPYYGMDFSGFKTTEPLNEIAVHMVKRKKVAKAA